MKIKDLSSSNKVAGEGILRWKLQDVNGDSVQVELLRYHIPNGEVHLLSPQVLLKTIGGHTLQTVNCINVVLDNNNNFAATFCPHSNLLMIPLALDNNTKQCFWNKAFGFLVDSFGDINNVKNILHQANTNLSLSQKELLLWHQHLFHTSVKWIQAMMQDRKWLPSNDGNNTALHLGPFIPTKVVSHAHSCTTSTLQCAACLYAKASTRSPTNLVPRPSLKNNILKQNHLQPGDCLLADHYFSPIPGRLPYTFGQEKMVIPVAVIRGSCKWKNIQFSPIFQHCFEDSQKFTLVEAMAWEEGFWIKGYHSNNGIFASPEFKKLMCTA
jgi:hypothetical protein